MESTVEEQNEAEVKANYPGAEEVKETWTSWDNPVLTPEQWQEVRKACEAGMTYSEASEKWQIENATIRKRAQREEWITTTRIKIMAEKIIEKESQEKARLIESRQVTRGEEARNVPSNAIQAVVETFESHRSGSLLGLARTLKNTFSDETVQNMKPSNVGEVVQMGNLMLKLYNVGQDNVTVNVCNAFAGMEEGPVVSIDEEDDSQQEGPSLYFIDDE